MSAVIKPDTLMRGGRLDGCDGKERFRELSLAQRVAGRMRSAKKRTCAVHVYRCAFCSGWHIGQSKWHIGK